MLQLNHKHYERRLLVAESCGVLAPYIPVSSESSPRNEFYYLTPFQPELRGSLVLSMLKQMLCDDKAESVRQAVVKSLGVIVAFIDDEDKFKQCWELMLRALSDPSQLVVTSTYSILLPALAAWSFELDTLESELIAYFLHQLLTCIKVHKDMHVCVLCEIFTRLFFHPNPSHSLPSPPSHIPSPFLPSLLLISLSSPYSPSSPPLPISTFLPSCPSPFIFLPSFVPFPPLPQQVSRTDGESGAVEQSQHHILTLTHLVPWHYANILQTGRSHGKRHYNYGTYNRFHSLDYGTL